MVSQRPTGAVLDGFGQLDGLDAVQVGARDALLVARDHGHAAGTPPHLGAEVAAGAEAMAAANTRCSQMARADALPRSVNPSDRRPRCPLAVIRAWHRHPQLYQKPPYWQLEDLRDCMRPHTFGGLPAPLGPSKPKISPAAIPEATLPTAWTSPYHRCRPHRSSAV